MAPAAELGDARADVPAPGVRSFEARALGSALRLQVRDEAGSSDGSASAAWDEVVAEFAAVDLALSRFRDDSELTALNRRAGTGGVMTVSWRLRAAIAVMGRAARVTDGRFDPTFARELDALGERGADLARPNDGCDAGRTLERPRPVAVPATPLETGGIGKGLALRWAAARIARSAVDRTPFLLEAGGDVVVGGASLTPWLVGIEDPLARGGDRGPIAVVELAHGAVATSSVAVRHWTAPDGRAVHHLLDPRTREPARTGLLAVTVAAPDPGWAEIWTKALFLAGREAIRDEARARDIAAWWVGADGEIGLSPAARAMSVWVAEDRVR